MDSLLILSIPFALIFWIPWFSRLRPRQFSSPQHFTRLVVGILLPLACGVLLLGVLLRWSSPDVRADFETVAFYEVVGIAWVGASMRLLAFLGISLHDDVLERDNPAAAWVVAAQLIGVTCCFAGANIGSGPGPHVVLFCAILSTTSLVLLWLVFDRAASIADTVTIERDLPAGIRVAGWFVAVGIVLGAAVAGDWFSISRTLRDFAAYAWPAAFLSAVATFLERALPTRQRHPWADRPSYSALLAGGYIFLVALYVYKRGLF